MALPDWLGELESWLIQKAFVKFPIPVSKLVGYPNDTTKSLRGDGSWTAAVPYRKTTAKAVNTTTTATDLLNGEITVAASAMAATSSLRLTAFGDYKQNAGATSSDFRIQLVFGGTTLIDTGAGGFALENSATRYPWFIEAVITNTATNAQVCTFFQRKLIGTTAGAGSIVLATGEGGNYAPASATNKSFLVAEGYNTSAVDTTAAQTLVLNVINPNNNANTEFKLTSAFVEIF